jgi:hypothetical protein
MATSTWWYANENDLVLVGNKGTSAGPGKPGRKGSGDRGKYVPRGPAKGRLRVQPNGVRYNIKGVQTHAAGGVPLRVGRGRARG